MAKVRITRIVIDTNWFISASINKSSRRKLYKIFTHPAVKIFYCPELLDEYRLVISRKKFSGVITTLQSEKWIRLCLKMMIKSSAGKNIPVSRDPKDNYLISLSKECKAEYLITGDDDLLFMEKSKSVKIITMKNFLSVLQELAT